MAKGDPVAQHYLARGYGSHDPVATYAMLAQTATRIMLARIAILFRFLEKPIYLVVATLF